MKDKMIQIVVVKPGESPKSTYVTNTLASLQAAIGGGYLEIIGSRGTELEGFDVFFDEDGLSKGLAHNLTLPNGHTIVGTLIVSKAGADGAQVSLTDDEAARITKVLAARAAS